MKIEFVKETKANGDVTYFTSINGSYVNNSLALDREKAYSIYNNIVENKGKYTNIQVLVSTEIE